MSKREKSSKQDKHKLRDGEVRSLCKLKKHVEENFERLKEIVRDPRYICVKCGRVAKDEQFLCRPKKIDP